MAKDMAIGEVREHNGTKYECVEKCGCQQCDLYLTCIEAFDITGECVSSARSDSTSVMFKKVLDNEAH